MTQNDCLSLYDSLPCASNEWSAILPSSPNNMECLLYLFRWGSRKATGKQVAKEPTHSPRAGRCLETWTTWWVVRTRRQFLINVKTEKFEGQVYYSESMEWSLTRICKCLLHEYTLLVQTYWWILWQMSTFTMHKTNSSYTGCCAYVTHSLHRELLSQILRSYYWHDKHM